MTFSLELGGESAASNYVCVCERGWALGAYEGWVVFLFTSVDVYSPCHLQHTTDAGGRESALLCLVSLVQALRSSSISCCL